MKIIIILLTLSTLTIIQCQGFCSTGQYWSSWMGMCDSCPSNCKACTGSDDCSTCDAGFTKGKWGACECGNGTYLNSTSKKCQSCSVNCETCKNLTTCSKCEAAYKLVDGNCNELLCPVGQYYDYLRKECWRCLPNCDVCHEAYDCLQCAKGYQQAPKNMSCSQGCLPGTMLNSTSGQCVPCVQYCSDCFNQTGCISCESGYTLNANATACLPNNSSQIIESLKNFFFR